MLAVHVEKFPKVLFQGLPLIWDSRQPEHAAGEWVLVHLDAFEKPEIRKQLLSRKNARFIGPPGSGMDLVVGDTRKFLGLAAAAHYKYPSKKLKVFAVTGTNGKTTCCTLLRAQLVNSGLCVAELGTLGLRVFRGDKNKPLFATETGFTTADAPTLQDLFHQFVEQGIEAVTMEASSHAAVLGRVAGTDFDGLLFTNLTQDHLDFHGTMDAYEDAKARLFFDYLPGALSSSESQHFSAGASIKRKFAVLNAGDLAGLRILEALPPDIHAQGFAAKPTASHAEILGFQVSRADTSGTAIEVSTATQKIAHIETPLIGAFNAENVVGSFLLLHQAALDAPIALSDFSGAEGRMQGVSSTGQPAVFVDYSHTPDALEKALSTLRQVLPATAQLVVVFGCGGDRDPGKRPIMGEIAARIANTAIICSDNPRTEDPMAIIRQIEAGVPAAVKAKLMIEENRSEAIRKGISLLNAKRGDALLIAGKGHEDYQIVGTTKLPFSDIETARRLLKI